jgi:hypothetical protein
VTNAGVGRVGKKETLVKRNTTYMLRKSGASWIIDAIRY